MRALRLVLVATVFVVIAHGVSAHPLAPALLELTESNDGLVAVRWKTSLLKQPGVQLKPRLPNHCSAATQPRTNIDEGSVTTAWSIDCGRAGLIGAEVGVDGADLSASDTLLRVELADGRSLQAILRQKQTTFVIPERAARSAVMHQYAGLGFDHILGGFDHLLFVFGLVLLVRERRALLETVTAFTAGHSVTLSLAALGYTAFPTALIEVLIAFTILVLAIELAQARRSLLSRVPWAMAFVFGLLHGFGFAGALRQIGLPAGEIPAALFSFNVGIEIGQLLFIAVVLLLGKLLTPLADLSPAHSKRLPVYVMGSLAAYWMFERAAELLA